MAFDNLDIGTLRGLGTALVMLAFIGVTVWAYSSKRKAAFDEAANLPFADDPTPEHARNASRSYLA
ncbi:cbb3-type cytochrome oxidase subunit 3 [Pseudomonas indica]|jgi:cytochrome c oxidase cbb3-type subunit 4|uniref:Cytochrome c oxidase cbb3-type subunit 4 n=1 Tax=Pseudomonas indica TaxID=137658 RepID=A0A1G8XMM3_9PSED|nr:cbb3-type cytochrome c oxidase subunit 3 [Pseudomonas indica]MBU3054844.1 cbb3-type cytochrome c oxidase subunit 3 [Pseudomonas indica]PAU55592.1 cytochrome oxidase [Pseudomonas indica]SDJ91849.1 cytochrome c oxidase cbb3-type subunit 4 [Pseudomonas indica]